MSTTSSTAAPARRRLWWKVAALAIALTAIVAALALWTNSRQFHSILRHRIASQIETATGGRVEIASLDWHVFGLEAELGGLVIHGDEGPAEKPYARIDRLRVQLSVLGFFSPRILLRDLEIVHPQLHLIVYPDGATNQPHPRQLQKNKPAALDTLFDLRAGRIAVEQGWIDIDNRAAHLDFQDRYQPLDFRGEDVSLLLQYVAAAGRNPVQFHIEAGIRDLSLTRGGTAQTASLPVHGVLKASIDLTRNAAFLRSLQITSHARGVKDQTLQITGSLSNFGHPRWEATTKGDLDMRLLLPILGYPYAPEGLAHLDLNSAGEAGEFRIDGSVHAERASYIGTGVVARGVDLTAHVHADPSELRITSVVARLQSGGQISGKVLLAHWLPPVRGTATLQPQPAPASKPHLSLRQRFGRRLHPNAVPPKPATPQPPHSVLVKAPNVDIPVNGRVEANFADVSLDTLLEMVSVPPFQHLGLNAQINGPAVAVWNQGDVNTLSVNSLLNLSPAAHAPAHETPAHGAVDATYTQRNGTVDVRKLELVLASSQLEAHGRLGAYPLTSPTALTVDFRSSNLGEFDTVLRELGLSREGKSGTAALPIALGGQAEFHGTWGGSLTSPQLTGNAKATQLSVELPPSLRSGKQDQSQFIRWDSVEASGSYTAERIAIVHGQLLRGAAQLIVDGTLVAPAPPIKTGRASRAAVPGGEMPEFDNNSIVHAHVRATKLSTSDLLPLVAPNLPVSGSVDAQLQIDGPVHAPGGSGWIQLKDGVAYGEPVSSVRATGSLTNQTVHLSAFTIEANAGSIAGTGSYELQTRRVQLEAHGSGIDLSRIDRLRSQEVEGKLGFNISASGTSEEPQLDGHLTVAGLAVSGEPLGSVCLTAHTSDHALTYDGTAHFDSATVLLHGRTELRDDYNTQARLDFSQFNLGAVFKLSHLRAIDATSSLAGTVTLAGPLARPAELHGDVQMPQFAVTIAGVHMQSDSRVHATLDRARLSLDPLHVIGDHTDLHAQGALGLKDEKRLDFAASGSVNLALVETLDPDLTASGSSTFQIDAHGPLANPGLRGRVNFQNGAIALEDLPNSLSQINGSLEFNQNRLEVRSLTATTGGGQLNLGGYLAYQRGIYADVSLMGKDIRIRYPEGVSSLANASLRLQGTQNSLLLSGSILLTRFSVSPDLDIAGLATQATAVKPVASPNAPSNHVRLDVRIQSSPQLNFQNAYAKLAGDVDLRLRGTLATPSLLGRVSVTEGNATIAGTRYELQRGDVTFTNPVRIQPNIDLNATARVEDYDITLSLHGTPDKLSVTYRSDPPLPETDVVALLALGRTQSEQGLYTEQQQQSAGLNPSTDLLLGGALNATVSSRVQRLFGAGSVKVDPSYLGALGNSTTRITVEEQLGKNVTLTYATNVNTTAQQLLQAEIAVNRHVSLVVARDESGVFSMVLKATRRYR